jgi:hypothetical protein
MTRPMQGWFAALCLGLLAWSSAGDTLVSRDGKTLEGEVLKREDGKVTFRYYLYGSPIVKTFDETEIVTLKKGEYKRPARKTEDNEDDQPEDDHAPPDPGPKPKAPPIRQIEGVSYLVVPLHGVVGQQITADLLEACLADAVLREPTVVILEVQSPGGLIQEVPRLAEVIGRYRDRLRLVVFVREAMSAAAITALGVGEILVHPNARFGAATAWKVGPSGTPTKIEEKFQSAWRATARSMAEMGRHEPLLAEAMIDANLELHVRQEDGRPVVAEGSAPQNTRELTRKGKLLTLTAGEAVACGLADAQAKNYAELGTKLGLPGWKRHDALAKPLAEWHEKQLQRAAWELGQLTETYKTNLDKARAVDPQKGQYKMFQNKAFTPSSRQRWQSRTRTALSYLRRADQALDSMEQLLKDKPQLPVDPSLIDEARDGIEQYRNRLNSQRDRQGP